MEKIMSKYGGLWGVYKKDCYQLSGREKANLFLRAFEDFSDALRFAQSYSKDAVIHIIPNVQS